ncbi:MAG TPA: hypothetical protein VFJ16_29050 [Longimicrobium sp.]|nr:hypothetical protein [Longimicrobium sp.]
MNVRVAPATAAIALLLAGGCATAGPVDLREFHARQLGDERMLAGLKMMYTVQQTYQAANGRFAASTEELREVGWRDADFGGFRPVVTDPGSRLCIAMLPTDGARRAWSMDGEGFLYRGPRCGR